MRTPESDQKILSIPDLCARRARLRQEGKTVVQCHGCFDIVHPGHIRYLRFARSLGDVLVVTVSSDDAV
ncbi:MAG: adenylyltransferase/cytidyltransferase family protein, partial [Polyangiales bacterium]